MNSKKINEKYLKICFIAFVFFMCFIWSINMKINTTPDEGMKFDVIKYIVKHGRIPEGQDPEIRNKIWGISYAFNPILSYMIGAGFVKIVSLFTKSLFVWYVASRFVSVLCNTLMTVFVIKIADRLFKDRKKGYKWLFITSVSLLPQVIFLGSYINNDSLALLSISIIVYAWLKGYDSGWNIKSCIFLGLGIGFCALSYYNAFGYILTSIFVYIAYFILHKKDKIEWKKMLLRGFLIFGVAFIIGGWWYIRSAYLYDGDFIGLKTSTYYGNKYAMDQYKPSQIMNPCRRGVSLRIMLITENWILMTFRSFVGVFSVMNFLMSNLFYDYYFLAFFVGYIGMTTKYLGRKNLKKLLVRKDELFLRVIFIVNIIIPVILSIIYSYYSDYQPQGRYIMPMLIPFMYFFVTGMEYLISRLINSERIQNMAVYGIIIINFLSPIYCLKKVINLYGIRLFELL